MTLLLAIRTAMEASAGTAINGLFAGLFIAVLTALLLKLLGRQNPGTRFAVWFASLLAVAAIPFLYLILNAPMPSIGHANSPAVLRLPGTWAFLFFTVWVTVSGLACLRLAIGLWKLRRLWSSCNDLDLSAHPLLDRTVRQH